MTVSYGESLLRQFLEIMVPDLERIYNYRPDWLQGLELDIYFPQARVGVEFNGDQHYVPTEFGHPGAQKKRDNKKRDLCEKNCVELRVVLAIDLEWTRLNPIRNTIIERAHEYCGTPDRLRTTKYVSNEEFRKCQSARAKERKKLRPLNKLSKEYRERLIRLYDSPTARLPGKSPQKMATRRAWSRNS